MSYLKDITESLDNMTTIENNGRTIPSKYDDITYWKATQISDLFTYILIAKSKIRVQSLSVGLMMKICVDCM